MPQTGGPLGGRGAGMELRWPDLSFLAHHVYGYEGVRNVYVLFPHENEATMWVTVEGEDETSEKLRHRVYEEVETFIRSYAKEMEYAHFNFDYYVLSEDDDVVGTLQAAGAERVP